MGGIADAVGGIFGGGGDDGASAARDAANIQAQYQREALDYLKEREALPQQYREGALNILGGLYGLGGAPSAGVSPAAAQVPGTAQADIPARPELNLQDYVDSSYARNPMSRLMAVMEAKKQHERDLAAWEAQYGDMAQTQAGGAQVIPGAASGASRESAVEALQSNPLYQATLGMLPAQEEAILRSQAATGALRTSGSEQMLAENQRRNQLAAYQNAIGPLQGLAGLQSYAPQIAQGISNIGQTQAQGLIGAEQSRQAGQQAGFGNLLGLGQLGLAAFSAFCDPSLKSDAKKIGEFGGYQIYRWTWNDKAADLGLSGEGIGPMADEIEKFEPDRIEIRNGYKYVRAV